LDDFFQKNTQFFLWKRPRAGSTAFVKFIHKNSNISELASELVDKDGILILPDEVYGMKSKGFWRLGYGRKNVPDILHILQKFLNENIS
jgi:aspartate/methionine/tyrosine aminotransferase